MGQSSSRPAQGAASDQTRHSQPPRAETNTHRRRYHRSQLDPRRAFVNRHQPSEPPSVGANASNAANISDPEHASRPGGRIRRWATHIRRDRRVRTSPEPPSIEHPRPEAQSSPQPRDSLEMTRNAQHPQEPIQEEPYSSPEPVRPRRFPSFRLPSRPSSGVYSPIRHSSPPQIQDAMNTLNGLSPPRGARSGITASIRRRRARPVPAEDNAAGLQTMLSRAAAATAASLMGGNPESAVNDLRRSAVPVDSEDGSFYNFLQALSNGRLASHLGRSEDGSSSASESNTNSLDFFRMFRLGSHGPSGQQRQDGIAEEGGTANDGHQQQQNTPSEPDREGRTVSVLIVGIRSLSGENNAPDQADTMPSFIDALTNINTTMNVGLQDQLSNGSLGSRRSSVARPLSGLSRNSFRRASMGGMFSNRNSMSPIRGSEGSRPRPISEILTPTDRSTSPELPVPPVQTASPAISEGMENDAEPSMTPPMPSRSPRARDSWPSRRNSWRHSWASRGSLPSRANRHSMIEPMPEELIEDHEEAPPRRNRPRSEGDFLRFGSGSSRRNGIVEPDNNVPGHRSWIIYVLGGNYPEDHPILTTPSLFTDNPTYEDMLLLQSLLGPAKPVVAQQEDLDAAHGLFSIELSGNAVEAHEMHAVEPLGKMETLVLDTRQACQICLLEYTHGEVARRLGRCQHLFHRHCIDYWLTTGKNSCPLCRAPGVAEISSPERPTSFVGPASSPRPMSYAEPSSSEAAIAGASLGI